ACAARTLAARLARYSVSTEVSMSVWTRTSTSARRPASAGSRTSASRQITPATSPRCSSMAMTLRTRSEPARRAVSACPSPCAAPVTATAGDVRPWRTGAHAVAAERDRSVLDVDRQKIVDALRLADLWLDETTSFSTGVRLTQAWSRSEWVEATLPVWSKLCDPIADRAVDAMGGMLAEDPSELGSGLPPELGEAFKAISGGLSGLGGMMRRIGGMMVGSQTGTAVGALAREVVSSTDIGLPLGPEGTAALLPA